MLNLYDLRKERNFGLRILKYISISNINMHDYKNSLFRKQKNEMKNVKYCLIYS